MRLTTPAIALTVLLLAACGGAPQAGTQVESRTEVNTSFEELIALGKDYTCTFTDTDEAGATTEGTVQVAAKGKRLRGEFMHTPMAGTATAGHIIRDGTKVYLWDAAQAKGMMMDVPEESDDLFAGAEAGQEVGLDEDATMTFNCEDWTPEADSFAPPANVEFMDFSAQMNAAIEATGGMQGQQCAACAQITDTAAQAQCKKALGC